MKELIGSYNAALIKWQGADGKGGAKAASKAADEAAKAATDAYNAANAARQGLQFGLSLTQTWRKDCPAEELDAMRKAIDAQKVLVDALKAAMDAADDAALAARNAMYDAQNEMDGAKWALDELWSGHISRFGWENGKCSCVGEPSSSDIWQVTFGQESEYFLGNVGESLSYLTEESYALKCWHDGEDDPYFEGVTDEGDHVLIQNPYPDPGAEHGPGTRGVDTSVFNFGKTKPKKWPGFTTSDHHANEAAGDQEWIGLKNRGQFKSHKEGGPFHR